MEFSETNSKVAMVQVHIKAYDTLEYRTELTVSEAKNLVAYLESKPNAPKLSIN